MIRSPTLVSAGRAFGVRATRRSPGNVSRGTPIDNEVSSAIQPSLSARGPPDAREVAACRPPPTPMSSFLRSFSYSLHQAASVLDDVVRRESELGHHLRPRRRGAEVVQGDGCALLADPALPAEPGGRLDRQAGTHGGGEDLVAVALRLGREQVPGGHADDAGTPALPGGAVLR